MQLTEKQIIARIRARGRGLVFTPKLFAAVSDDPRAVSTALGRLARKGAIRHLGHGLYDLPKRHPKLGLLMPTVDAVVRAIQGSEAITVQPTGAYAANLLGLSTQVPMRVELYTNGPRKVIHYGRQQILLKPTTPRNMAAAGTKAGLIIQALRHLGQRNVNDDIITRIAAGLDDRERKLLLKHRIHAPAWIARILTRLSEKPLG
jgi:hypothetical protein